MDSVYRHNNWNHNVTSGIVCGAQLQDITNDLAKMSRETIESLDCTIVVCMLNAPPNREMLSFEEMNGIGIHINALCAQLQKHKRAAIIIGGAADLWRFPPQWDQMVEKCVSMCRAHGIPTIDGVHDFRRMEIQEHGFHLVKTEDNTAKGLAMLEETRNMLYVVFPHGCYAKLVALPQDEVSNLTTPPTQVGSCAFPTQVGMAASSSSDMHALPAFPAPHATYVVVLATPKVGWHSEPVLCPLRELWPPLERHSVAKREAPKRQPVTVLAAFQVKEPSQADRRRERQELGKAAAAVR